MKCTTSLGLLFSLSLAASLVGCSLEGSARISMLGKFDKPLAITKKTETSVPAQPAQAEHVDTQEVKVNPK